MLPLTEPMHSFRARNGAQDLSRLNSDGKSKHSAEQRRASGQAGGASFGNQNSSLFFPDSLRGRWLGGVAQMLQIK